MKQSHLTLALSHLSLDPHFAPLILRLPKPKFTKRDPFEALVSAIIYQQLSGKAAGTIHKRFLGLFPKVSHPSPKQIIKVSVDKMRSVGLSGQKISYLKDLSEKFLDGEIEPEKFSKMTDEEIREHLIRVKGIGRWTADMFLMFTLHRPDVLPTGDLGIQKGMQRVYKLKSLPDPVRMEKIAKPLRPYATVACWYLWRDIDESDQNGQW